MMATSAEASSPTPLLLLLCCVFVASVSLLPQSVEGHGYLSFPISRNYLASRYLNSGGSLGMPVNYCPHCLEAGSGSGQRSTPFVYPETPEAALGHGLCGDGGNTTSPSDPCWAGGNCPSQNHMPGGQWYLPSEDGVGAHVPAINIFEEGQEVEFEMVITAHHRGWVEMRLCDSHEISEDCFQRNVLPRVRLSGEDEDIVPLNPNYPSLWYLPPSCAVDQTVDDKHVTGYHYKANFKLPDGVSCTSCVVQWWWVVGDTCVIPGYDGFEDLPGVDSPGSCGPGQLVSEWYNSRSPATCGQPESVKVRQEFWNCADITINPKPSAPTSEPTGTPAPTPEPTIAGPTPAPTTAAPTCLTEIGTWGKCGGQDQNYSTSCCEPGTYCRNSNPYYSQCIPGSAPSPAPAPAPTSALTAAPTPALPTGSTCSNRSTLPGYACMMTVADPGWTFHWAQPSAGPFRMAARAEQTGWIGVGFPTTAGEMVGASALQGSADGLRSILLGSQSSTGFQPIAIPGVDPGSISFTLQDGHALLEFVRLPDTGFSPLTGPIDMVGAFHFLPDLDEYHAAGRFAFSVALTQAAVGDAYQTPEPSSPTPGPTNPMASTPGPTIPTLASPGPSCRVIVPTYSQCGGSGLTDEGLCCASGEICVSLNDFYSQCRPDVTITEAPAQGGGCDQQLATWAKCGGRDRSYEGSCCQAEDTCIFVDLWYSQCQPPSTLLTRRMLRMA